MLARMLQAGSLAFLFIPMNTLAFRDVPAGKSKRGPRQSKRRPAAVAACSFASPRRASASSCLHSAISDASGGP